jgi:hypothetical protein
MTCPRCHSEFEKATDVCPECGVSLVHNVSGVMKTSAVLIAARGEQGFYRSVQDVPEPLRTQLLETTTSPNSGIIVIADRAGKEQLTQVMARREARPAGIQTAQPVSQVIEAAGKSALPGSPAAPRLPWLAWTGFALVLALAAIIFLMFQSNWAIFRIH